VQCYEKDRWNKNVFRWRRKDRNDDMETRLPDSVFQTLAAATGKARLPIVVSLKGGTTRKVGARRERYVEMAVHFALAQ